MQIQRNSVSGSITLRVRRFPAIALEARLVCRFIGELDRGLVLRQIKGLLNLPLALNQACQTFTIFERSVDLHLRVNQSLPCIGNVLCQSRSGFFKMLDDMLD